MTDPSGVRPFLQAQPAAAIDRAEVDDPATLRPFVLTAGRVGTADPSIGMETQVTTTWRASHARLSPEERAIVELCAQPLSVAEVSARLGLHLGVAGVLVGDLRAAGYLDVHVLENDVPDAETIRRVIRGLRAIA